MKPTNMRERSTSLLDQNRAHVLHLGYQKSKNPVMPPADMERSRLRLPAVGV